MSATNTPLDTIIQAVDKSDGDNIIEFGFFFKKKDACIAYLYMLPALHARFRYMASYHMIHVVHLRLLGHLIKNHCLAQHYDKEVKYCKVHGTSSCEGTERNECHFMYTSVCCALAPDVKFNFGFLNFT